MQKPLRIGVTLIALAGLVSCNSYPVKSLVSNFTVRVTEKLANDKPVQLDILWVIDHSTSMCQEQNALSKGIAQFTESLKKLVAIDAQMAVVTLTQVPYKDSSTGKVMPVGKFWTRPAAVYPPNCYESVPRPCVNDTDCQNGNVWPHQYKCLIQPEKETFDKLAGSAMCVKPSVVSKIENLNCSVNSSCAERCKSDEDCKEFLGAGEQAGIHVKCVPPGSADAKCQRVPVSSIDSECMATNDDGSFVKCDEYGNPKESGKYNCPREDLPAIVRACPGNLPGCEDTLDKFKCIATVGAAIGLEPGFEGALRSAWIALDPFGPYCPRDESGAPTDACQFKNLVRPNAYLVIIFVSDDDDCSVDMSVTTGEAVVGSGTKCSADPNDNACIKAKVSANDWPQCQVLGSKSADNPWLNIATTCGSLANSPVGKACRELLAKPDTKFVQKSNPYIAPVSYFVNAFKSLKDDPARVIVAAISGDAPSKKPDGTATTDEEKDDLRVHYYQARMSSKGDPPSVSICASASGVAGFGSRYLALTQAFGRNGVFRNICDSTELGAALEAIADTILRRVVKVCLPHPKEKGETILVRKRTADNKEVFMTEGTGDDQFTIAASPDCRAGKGSLEENAAKTCASTAACPPGLDCIDGRCQVYDDAIFFNQKLEPGDTVEINYAADVGFSKK